MVTPTPPSNARGRRNRGRGRGRASPTHTPTQTVGASITVQPIDDESLLEEQFQDEQRSESSPLSPPPITPTQYDQIMARLDSLSQENTQLRIAIQTHNATAPNDAIPTIENGKAIAGRTRQQNAQRSSRHISTSQNRQSIAPRRARASSPESSTSRNTRLSAKVKDVPQLDDGISNPSLVQWQVLLKSKLTTNADHFAKEVDKKTHVFACTTGKAATLLETAMAAEDDPEDAFPDWESMIEYLVTSLRNPHEKADARHEYKKLRMEVVVLDPHISPHL